MKLSGLYDGDQTVVEPPNQEGLVSFEQVTVYFFEEEWSQLDPDQKALYSEVMLKNHRNVVSLGNNGQENQVSCEVFQVISAKDETEKFGIRMEFKSHKRNQSKNWNQESSSSSDALMQGFLAQEEKIRKKYTGKSVKLMKAKVQVNEHYLIQNKGKDAIRRHKGQNYNGTSILSLGKKFLTSQKAIDTKEKPYKCLQFGKSFRTSRQLTSHERIHTTSSGDGGTERRVKKHCIRKSCLKTIGMGASGDVTSWRCRKTLLCSPTSGFLPLDTIRGVVRSWRDHQSEERLLEHNRELQSRSSEEETPKSKVKEVSPLRADPRMQRVIKKGSSEEIVN
uniref:Uncharacterized protein n=1 Tax=Naja naja TaxID=35670 RepID=A0A8C6X5P2_NAJNA